MLNYVSRKKTTPAETELSSNHWTIATFKQRMTTKEWRKILLAHADTLVFQGHVVRLAARSLGCGVVEVSKVFDELRAIAKGKEATG